LSNTTVSNIPIVEFKVPLCCGKCEEKVKEELENVEGVYKVVCDQHNQRVTVSSTLDPQRLLKRVKRIKKNSHFWSSYHVPGQHVQIRPYVSPRSSYDPAHETQYVRRKAQVLHPEPYHAGAENQYKMSPSASPFRAGTPYMESSLNYGHLSSSYGSPYEDYLEIY
jgi:copper chaperone CopZ